MKDRQIREQRCLDALKYLVEKGRCSFFTLTTPDTVDLHGIRERWRLFRHSLAARLRRNGERAAYVMNYELHPGYLQRVVEDRRGRSRVIRGTGLSHGWHIHGVIDCRLRVQDLRNLLLSAGFGRTDVRPVSSLGVSEYLTKHALKAYRGLTRKEREVYRGMRLRLVNTSRGLPRLDDYAWDSELIRETARIRNLIKGSIACPSRHDFRRVQQVAEICALMGFEDPSQYGPWLRDVVLHGV